MLRINKMLLESLVEIFVISAIILCFIAVIYSAIVAFSDYRSENFCSINEDTVIHDYEKMYKSYPIIDDVRFEPILRNFSKDKCEVIGKTYVKSGGTLFTPDRIGKTGTVSLKYSEVDGDLSWYISYPLLEKED